jgi:hypothetical protein
MSTANYENLIAQGDEPKTAATTWAWTCGTCGTVTYVGAAGGPLDCDCSTDGDNVFVAKIFAGTREELGTANDIAERAQALNAQRRS